MKMFKLEAVKALHILKLLNKKSIKIKDILGNLLVTKQIIKHK